MPQKSSWLARQKEEGSESRYSTTPQAASNVPLAHSAGGRGKCVFVPHRHTLAPRCLTAVIAESNETQWQNKTHTFFKREQKSFSAYHKRSDLMQPVFTAVSTCCHAGRGLADHPQCVRVGNGNDKMRLYSPIRSKTTVLPLCARHHSAQRGCSSHSIVPPAQSESGL